MSTPDTTPDTSADISADISADSDPTQPLRLRDDILAVSICAIVTLGCLTLASMAYLRLPEPANLLSLPFLAGTAFCAYLTIGVVNTCIALRREHPTPTPSKHDKNHDENSNTGTTNTPLAA